MFLYPEIWKLCYGSFNNFVTCKRLKMKQMLVLLFFKILKNSGQMSWYLGVTLKKINA